MKLLTERGIDYWTSIYGEGPEVAANVFASFLETVSLRDRNAALAYVPQIDGLRQAFAMAEHSAGSLRGVPYVLKDLFDLSGIPTGAGSTFLPTVRPLPKKNADMVRSLEEHGAVCCAKTHLNEFAYGLTGENPHFGDCPHPRLDYSLAGGSSSGTAWAVGSGLVPFGIGTDTAGSIRVPSAFCGLFGLRLPHLQWATRGCFPLAPSFDTVGWLTRTPEDMLCVNEAMLGNESGRNGRRMRILDLTSFGRPFPNELQRAYERTCAMLNAIQDPEVSAWLSFNFVGCESAYSILSSREAYLTHKDWLQSHKDEYDPIVWRRIHNGGNWTESEIAHAKQKRHSVTQAFKDSFLNYDAVVMPVTTKASPTKDEMTSALRSQLLQLNTPVSLARLPALTIPVKLSNGTSGGLQIVFPSQLRLRAAEVLALFSGEGVI